MATVPDLVGEPMQALGNTRSRSISFIRAYTTDIVSRYGASPAVWAWEFGNECNLLVDLPNAAEHRPQIAPELGTPNHRTEMDELKFSQLLVAYQEFARVTRSLDAHRLIVSGNSVPRDSAWHNTHEGTWTRDSARQFRDVLRRDNPDPMNGISVHLYPDEKFPAGAMSSSETLTLVAQECEAAGKPLFVGEFGVSRRAGAIEEQKREFGKLLAAIEQAHAPLAAAWVFDFPGQDQDWNINFQNDRAVFLKMISEMNKWFKQQ